MSHVVNYLDEKKGSIGDNLTTSKLDQAQWHYNTARIYGDQSVASYQEGKSYAETASNQRQQGVSSTSNLNEKVLRQIADRQFGGDMYQAAQAASWNPDMLQQEVSRYIDSHQPRIRPQELGSEAAVKQDYESKKLAIKDVPPSNATMEAHKEKSNFNKDIASLEKKMEESQKQAKLVGRVVKEAVESKQSGLEASRKKQEEEFQRESDKWAITRIVERIFK
jgi:hypothetical protein